MQFSFIATTSYDRQDEQRLQSKAKISINPDQWVTLTDGTGGWVNSTFLEPSDVSLDTSILRERLGDTPVFAVSFELERCDNKYPCGQHNGPCCSLQHIKVLRKLANVMQSSPPPQETYWILDPPDARPLPTPCAPEVPAAVGARPRSWQQGPHAVCISSAVRLRPSPNP